MERSLVVFGPGHVGKSTLIGYMKVKLDPEFDFDRFDQELQQYKWYKADRRFAYILDTYRDERDRKIKSKKGIGNTRYMHTDRIKINNNEILVIDTPGAEHRSRERIKGIYFGDIGLCMISANKLKDIDLFSSNGWNILQKFFTPLILWSEFHSESDKLIIVISKTDKIAFSEDTYWEFVNLINLFLSSDKFEKKSKNIKILPISIDVKRAKDENVFSKSNDLKWYKGPSLYTIIEEIYKIPILSEIKEPLFIHVEGEYNKPIGKIIRGKVLKGEVKKGDIIKLSPIYKNEYLIATAEVRNIKLYRGGDVERAGKGDLITILLSNIKINGIKGNFSDFEITKTSNAVAPGFSLLKGRVLQMKVKKEDADKIHLLDSVSIIWFGKLINAALISKEFNVTDVILDLEFYNTEATLPIDINGGLIHKKFIIKLLNDLIYANLERIGNATSLNIRLEIDNKLMPRMDEYFKEYKYEKLDNNMIKFHKKDSLLDLMYRIRKFNNKYLIAPETIYSTVRINLEDNKI